MANSSEKKDEKGLLSVPVDFSKDAAGFFKMRIDWPEAQTQMSSPSAALFYWPAPGNSSNVGEGDSVVHNDSESDSILPQCDS